MSPQWYTLRVNPDPYSERFPVHMGVSADTGAKDFTRALGFPPSKPDVHRYYLLRQKITGEENSANHRCDCRDS